MSFLCTSVLHRVHLFFQLKVLVKQITQDTSQRKDVMACQSTMFVCNKWDQVPVDETDVVWDYTMRELGKIWPDLSPEQVFRMDTKLVGSFSLFLSSSEVFHTCSYKSRSRNYP